MYDYSYNYYLPCLLSIAIVFHRRTESHIIIDGWHVHWRTDICILVFNIVLIVTRKILCIIAEFVRNFTPLSFMTINHDMHFLYSRQNMIIQAWVVEWISSLEGKPHWSAFKITPILIIYLLHQISCMDSFIFQTIPGIELDLACMYEIKQYSKLPFRLIQ